MVCAFTGHRAMKWPIDGELFERSLVNLIENFEIYTFLDGMAMGFDLFAERKVIELKKKYRIELVACIPYGDQISSMKVDDRQLYEYVLENCDDVRIISAEYYPGCLYARNRYMVDNADCVFGYYHGGKGGTRYTLDYAERCEKKMIII